MGKNAEGYRASTAMGIMVQILIMDSGLGDGSFSANALRDYQWHILASFAFLRGGG